ncbi:MAG: KamA family radical SAM protein [Deltaproteobacteria bacterium]|nr:KamA family radical SAM protein [Deltaproteobacteria bacterium]
MTKEKNKSGETTIILISATKNPPAPWADVPLSKWNDWQWQLRHRLTNANDLATVIKLSANEIEACKRVPFALAVTPYYASLINTTAALCPIRRQAIPSTEELIINQEELEDPLAEETHMPVTGLTHRYQDRALLYLTHNCPVYCRHCNRKRKVGDPSSALKTIELHEALNYLKRHYEVRDVLISGGDPLTINDDRLNSLLHSLRAIEHLEIIRLATRTPVTLPQRITKELTDIIAKYHPIYVNTHFNHPSECTNEAAQALEQLANAGCVTGNQMVLLKGINDDPTIVTKLNHWLLRHRCRPYYIFQADLAQGIAHFRTPISSGLKILAALRGHTSGLAVPHYVVDLPGGGGKVDLSNNYLVSHKGKTLVFNNYEGHHFSYEEG